MIAKLEPCESADLTIEGETDDEREVLIRRWMASNTPPESSNPVWIAIDRARAIEAIENGWRG